MVLQTKNLHIERHISFSKQYTYLVFSSLAMQGRLIQTKVYYYIFLALPEKKTANKPSKVATAKNVFSRVYVTGIDFFIIGFLLHVITGRHCFLKIFMVTVRFLETTICCWWFWNKCFERSQYFNFYRHNKGRIIEVKLFTSC